MRPSRTALALAVLAFAAAAVAAPGVAPQRLMPGNAQPASDALFSAAELEQREERQAAAAAGDRGAQCTDEAKAQNLQGDDYRHFMIRCMQD